MATTEPSRANASSSDTPAPEIQRVTNYRFFKDLLGGEESRPFILSRGTTAVVSRLPNSDLLYKDRETEPVVLKCNTPGWEEICWFLEPQKGRENNPSLSWGQGGNPMSIDRIRTTLELSAALLKMEQKSPDLSEASAPQGWGRLFRRRSA